VRENKFNESQTYLKKIYITQEGGIMPKKIKAPEPSEEQILAYELEVPKFDVYTIAKSLL